jgi:8-oxo-dGTP pyrophosphatase MutT (NUDIX family)
LQPLDHHRYTDENKSHIAGNLTIFTDNRQSLDGHRHAAVALAIYEHEGEASIIVTRRSVRLKEHSGQWALPGGRQDEGETAIEAALRELREEVNLDLGPQDVLGTLDDYITRSGYVITPVVVWANTRAKDLHPNPDEVASIHAFTFTELARPDSPNFETIPESERQVLSMNYLDDVIYAPTAAMLYQFREVAIMGLATRVLDYDQPVFAWR